MKKGNLPETEANLLEAGKNLLEMTVQELADFMGEAGEAPFRGRQIFKWIQSGAETFDEMSNLPLKLRGKLAEQAYIGLPEVLEVQRDESDGTKKLLFGLKDENCVEGVFMKYRYGSSICVSSQVGCKMGCTFCASALGGFVRNLTAGEMLGQILAAEKICGEKVNHVVVMGMGEPFDNYDSLSRFLRLLHEPLGKGMSYRNITVSTSGIIPAIERFGDDFPQVNLAVSLHRADSRGRSRIMPVNEAYPLETLLKAVRNHTEKTGRRVTFEYALIRGENDSDKDVKLLKEKLRGMLCHVNLIPLNRVDESGFQGSSRRRAEEIAAELVKSGIPATVRRELGAGIDGACGQLRRRRG